MCDIKLFCNPSQTWCQGEVSLLKTMKNKGVRFFKINKTLILCCYKKNIYHAAYLSKILDV